mmetsp:Transcript_11118/g.23744  ORF Transcript_11118/g.23744 Transcript_11118/m.23744 type:complete len:261 (-) Transcript_11118:117-899(-)
MLTGTWSEPSISCSISHETSVSGSARCKSGSLSSPVHRYKAEDASRAPINGVLEAPLSFSEGASRSCSCDRLRSTVVGASDCEKQPSRLWLLGWAIGSVNDSAGERTVGGSAAVGSPRVAVFSRRVVFGTGCGAMRARSMRDPKLKASAPEATWKQEKATRPGFVNRHASTKPWRSRFWSHVREAPAPCMADSSSRAESRGAGVTLKSPMMRTRSRASRSDLARISRAARKAALRSTRLSAAAAASASAASSALLHTAGA